MSLKTISLAFIFGFIGGLLGFLSAWTFVRPTIPNANPVAAITRAHVYELVDGDGRTIGRWGSEANHAVALTLFDQKGFKAAELSASDGMRSLEFVEGKDHWRRMSLVAAPPGIAALTLGDDFRQARLTLGAFPDHDSPPPSGAPEIWGLVVRGRITHPDYLGAVVHGNADSGDARASMWVLRPNGTYWNSR
jgi:hypothetical protein